MLVEFKQDKLGFVILTIKNKRNVAKIRKYLDQYADLDHRGDGLDWPFDGVVYFQSVNHLACTLSLAEIDEIARGWPVTKRLDDWVVLSWVGYSAADYVRLK